ncbi:MAG: hypothetical protein PHE89_05585 [Alphaproteobacteria bacterium]|nr:hypothetical protein [Alphaproteobacteria bacterium]
MDKIIELIKKFGNLICVFATSYYLVLGLLDVDILHHMFDIIGLGFIVNLIYILVGLIGVYKILEIYKPEILKDLEKKNKKK